MTELLNFDVSNIQQINSGQALRYCPVCNEDTLQTLIFDTDYSDSWLSVWNCSICWENISIV